MWSAISRATMSGVEPGPNGTMILTAFVGQSCAAAAAGASKSADNAKATLLFIELSLALLHVIIRATYPCVRVGAAIITGDAPSQAWSSRNCTGGQQWRDAGQPCLPTCHALYCLACQRASAIGISARLDRKTHGSGYSCARTGAVLRSTRLRDVARTARGGDQADRGGALQGTDVARFPRWAHPDRLRLRAVSGERLDQRVGSADVDLLRHTVLDVSREPQCCVRLQPWQ